MTAETRLDRDLPAILDALYVGPSPDYRDEVMAAAVRSRQRPSWTFAGRWFPVADIATRPVMASRVPWRAIGAALIAIALVLAAALAVVGSRQTKVPPPFGPARNGLITYAADGDIYSIDPVTGTSTRVTQGPAVDEDPVFSPDGTQLAFARAGDIVVAEPNGSRERVITAAPIPGGPRGITWAPNSGSLLVGAPDGSALWLFDATRAAEPRVIATSANPYPEPFRPPDGNQILASRADPTGRQLVVLDLATGNETVLAKGGRENDYSGARWSPDGAKVVFNGSTLDDISTLRLFEVRPDGTGLRQLTNAPGSWLDFDPVWSPDGSRIAFVRWELVGSAWTVRPVGILDVATGSVRDVGPLPGDVRAEHAATGNAFATTDETFQLAWSPDSVMLLAQGNGASGHPVLINAVDGTWSVIDEEAELNVLAQSWQRVAP